MNGKQRSHSDKGVRTLPGEIKDVHHLEGLWQRDLEILKLVSKYKSTYKLKYCCHFLKLEHYIYKPILYLLKKKESVSICPVELSTLRSSIINRIK